VAGPDLAALALVGLRLVGLRLAGRVILSLIGRGTLPLVDSDATLRFGLDAASLVARSAAVLDATLLVGPTAGSYRWSPRDEQAVGWPAAPVGQVGWSAAGRVEPLWVG
jgi:hypothetical protein